MTLASGPRLKAQGSWPNSFPQALDADHEANLVAQRPDHEAHAEVAPLDRQARVEAADLDAAVLAHADVREVDRDGLRLPVHRQVARHRIGVLAGLPDLRALEDDLGELLGVEEVRALEVLVAPRVGGVHVLGPGGEPEAACRRVVGVEAELAGEPVDPAVEVAGPEMLDPEDQRRVRGVHRVVGRRGVSSSSTSIISGCSNLGGGGGGCFVFGTSRISSKSS